MNGLMTCYEKFSFQTLEISLSLTLSWCYNDVVPYMILGPWKLPDQLHPLWKMSCLCKYFNLVNGFH